MKERKAVIQVIAVLAIVLASFVSPAGVQASADDPLVGTWYVTWEIYTGFPHRFTGTAWFDIFTDGAGYSATVYIPRFGVLYEEWPVFVDGDTVYVGVLIGTLTGTEIQGEQDLPDLGRREDGPGRRRRGTHAHDADASVRGHATESGRCAHAVWILHGAWHIRGGLVHTVGLGPPGVHVDLVFEEED